MDLDALISFRHVLHRLPELAFEELGTSKNIIAILEEAGIQISTFESPGFSILCRVDGESHENGQSVLFQAYIDGAPVAEQNKDCPWSSERPQISHGNGHDGHCAALIGLMLHLATPSVKRTLSGTIFGLFQSAGQVGDPRLIEELETTGLVPSRVFSLINIPGKEFGHVYFGRHVAAMASVGINISIVGQASHAATPNLGCNPILSLSRLVQKLVSKWGPQCTLTSLHADTTTHVQQGQGAMHSSQASVGELKATIRAKSQEKIMLMLKEIQDELSHVNSDFEVSLSLSEVFEEVLNDPGALAHANHALKEAGIDIHVLDEPISMSLDFWRFTRRTSCALLCIGAGDIPALHSPQYDFPDTLLPIFIEVMSSLVVNKDSEHVSYVVPSPVLTLPSLPEFPETVEVPVQPAANCHIEISRHAVEHSAKALLQFMGSDVTIVSVVKASAYGLSEQAVIPILEGVGVNYFAVANAIEAKRCLDVFTSSRSRVQVMSPTTDGRSVAWCVNHATRVEPWIGTSQGWPLIQAELQHQRPSQRLRVHVEVETGLNRTGLSRDCALQVCGEIVKEPLVELCGVCTHLAGAEIEKNMERCGKQIEEFSSFLASLSDAGIKPQYVHTASSAAAILVPEWRFNMVRLGVSMTGHWPTPEVAMRHQIQRLKHPERVGHLELEPALTWKSTVIHLRDVPDGEFIGYGLSKQAQSLTRVAQVPVGYSDGFTTALSHVGYLIVRGRRAAVLGHINMSLVSIDVSGFDPPVQIGDEAVLIGSQGNERIAVHSFAESSFVNYELLCRLSRDIPRVVIDSSCV